MRERKIQIGYSGRMELKAHAMFDNPQGALRFDALVKRNGIPD